MTTTKTTIRGPGQYLQIEREGDGWTVTKQLSGEKMWIGADKRIVWAMGLPAETLGRIKAALV